MLFFCVLLAPNGRKFNLFTLLTIYRVSRTLFKPAILSGESLLIMQITDVLLATFGAFREHTGEKRLFAPSCPSVRMCQRGPHRTDFHEIRYWGGTSTKICQEKKNKIWLQSTKKIRGTLYEDRKYFT